MGVGYAKYGSGPSWGFVDVEGCSDTEAMGAEAIFEGGPAYDGYSSLDTLELVMVHSGGESREIDGAVAGIRRTGRMEGIIGTESRQNDNTRECRERDSCKKSFIFRHAGSLVLSARLVYQRNPSSVSFIGSFTADPMNSQVCSLLPKKIELAMETRSDVPDAIINSAHLLKWSYLLSTHLQVKTLLPFLVVLFLIIEWNFVRRRALV